MRLLNLSLMLLSLFFYSAFAKEQDVSLQLKWKHSFQFAGFYMAKEKGFYKDFGINVTIKEIDQGINVEEDVLLGKATYGLSDSALVAHRLMGKKLIALSYIFKNSPLALMSLKSSNINSLNDLKGKRVSIFEGSIKNASLLSMLAKKGLSIDDMKVIPQTFSNQDLIEGKTDAFAVYITNQPYQFKEKGIEYNLFSPQDYGFDFYGDILFTNEDEILKNRERVNKFIIASIKGWKYAFNHIEESIKVIQDKYNSQKLSYNALKFQALEFKKISGFEDKDYGNIQKSKIQSIATIFTILGFNGSKINYNDFIYQKDLIIFSKEECDFINSKKIKVITTATWKPFNHLNEKNELDGMSVDYWKLIERNSDLTTEIIIADKWNDVLKSIENKKADLTISTTITKDRLEYANFSKPYASFPIAIATSNDKGFISKTSHLNGRKVAVGENYSAHKIIEANYPDIDFMPVKNIDIALELLSKNKVYAVIDILPVLAYNISKYGYTNLKIAGSTEFDFNLQIMVRDDYPQLISIINKAIDKIKDDEKKIIHNKWIAVNVDKKFDTSIIYKIALPFTIVIVLILIWNYTLKKEINKRHEIEHKLEILATTDTLTTIANRYKIDMSLDEQIQISNRYNRALSLVFFDIDHFKNINDEFGHKTGDLILIDLAYLISKKIRKSDIFGRWGGEEFLIILPETNLKSALKMAEKFRHMIENTKFKDIGNKQLTCSFGVAQIKKDEQFDAIMARVDNALYNAKNSGRNRVIAAS